MLSLPWLLSVNVHMWGGVGEPKREVADSLLHSGLWQLVSAGAINTAHSGDQCPWITSEVHLGVLI